MTTESLPGGRPGAPVAGAVGAGERLLIALDIDGTLVLEDESFSPHVVAAVQDAVRAGHEVTLATGRSWEATERVMSGLGISPGYVVCSNGAAVLRRVDGGYERHVTETFDPSKVLMLLREHLPEARYLVELPDGSRLYTEFLDDWNLQHAERVAFEELMHQPVSRVVVISPDHEEEDFLRLVEDIGLSQVSYAVGWTAWLDIAPKGVDKSTGLERIREWQGIAADRVMVIGDGRNDFGMFAWALEGGGRAVAMGQSVQEVRDAAGEVTLSVEDGGVAVTLAALGAGAVQ